MRFQSFIKTPEYLPDQKNERTMADSKYLKLNQFK